MNDHRAIIVSGYDLKSLTQAHDAALKIFGKSNVEVTKITTRGAPGFASFVVCPDGHSALTEIALRNDSLRKRMIEWLSNIKHHVQWTTVMFGTCEPREELEWSRFSRHEKKVLGTIASVLTRLFDPEPAIVSGHDINEMLDVDLIKELELEEDEGNDIFTELERRLPFFFTSDREVVVYDRLTIRDILKTVCAHIQQQNTPPSAKKRHRPARHAAYNKKRKRQ